MHENLKILNDTPGDIFNPTCPRVTESRYVLPQPDATQTLWSVITLAYTELFYRAYKPETHRDHQTPGTIVSNMNAAAWGANIHEQTRALCSRWDVKSQQRPRMCCCSLLGKWYNRFRLGSVLYVPASQKSSLNSHMNLTKEKKQVFSTNGLMSASPKWRYLFTGCLALKYLLKSMLGPWPWALTRPIVSCSLCHIQNGLQWDWLYLESLEM